jgi:hypothetical protein
MNTSKSEFERAKEARNRATIGSVPPACPDAALSQYKIKEDQKDQITMSATDHLQLIAAHVSRERRRFTPCGTMAAVPDTEEHGRG